MRARSLVLWNKVSGSIIWVKLINVGEASPGRDSPVCWWNELHNMSEVSPVLFEWSREMWARLRQGEISPVCWWIDLLETLCVNQKSGRDFASFVFWYYDPFNIRGSYTNVGEISPVLLGGMVDSIIWVNLSNMGKLSPGRDFASLIWEFLSSVLFCGMIDPKIWARLAGVGETSPACIVD